MNVICTKNLMNVLNYTNVQSESANEVQSMCQDTVLEAKAPEKAPKAMKQPLLSQMPESTQNQRKLQSLSQKVSETTPHNTELTVMGMPIVHLNWNGDTPQVTEFTMRKIMPLAMAPNLLQSFAGRISLYGVSIELESINQRSLGNSNSGKGVHHSLNHNASPKILTTPSPPVNQRNISSRGGDPTAVRETSSTEGTSQYEGILFQHVYGPQGRWQSETSHQSETPKQVCGIRAFQNGGPAHSQGPHSEERLVGQGGPERCLLHDSNGTTASTSPPLHNGDRDISVQLPSIRTVYSSQSVHQAPKTCHRATESNRHSSSNLHGRHARHGPLQPDAQRACLPSAVLVRKPWIHHQQQEISAISYSGD